MSQAEDNPEARFVAIIEFHIRDVNTPGTKNFFIQLWPLLGVADNYTGSLLVELYEPQLAHLGERILEINPSLDKADVAMRAELIASMIEGLTVTTRWAQRKDDYFEALTRMVTQTALGIARRLVRITPRRKRSVKHRIFDDDGAKMSDCVQFSHLGS